MMNKAYKNLNCKIDKSILDKLENSLLIPKFKKRQPLSVNWNATVF